MRVDLSKMCATPSQVAFDRVNREVEEGSDLYQQLVEHVLQDDDTALEGGELDKARHCGFDRLLAHQHLQGVGLGRVGDIRGGVDRFGHAHLPTAQQVERAVMSNSEQPGSKLRRLVQILQRHESPDECVLHDVLAVDDRSHEARAVTVQIGPQLAGQSEELRPTVLVQRGPSCAQAAAASSIVTPVSPLSPKAKPSAYFGSSSTETTFSPNSRGDIGAPKRATNSSGFMPMACA